MFSGSLPCLLGQHGSFSSTKLPVELAENMLRNLFLNLPPQTVVEFSENLAVVHILCLSLLPFILTSLVLSTAQECTRRVLRLRQSDCGVRQM